MGILSIVIKKVAEQANKIVLLGALVGGVSMMSYATETTVGPTIEKAQLETVDINLDEVIAALTVIDPAWAESLPKVKDRKRKGNEVLKKGVSPLAETKGAQPTTQYVFFPGTDDEDCDAINLNQYMGPSTPPTVDEGVNPAGCDGGNLCCGKAYPAANVQYNPIANRWEPTSETGVQYFQKSP